MTRMVARQIIPDFGTTDRSDCESHPQPNSEQTTSHVPLPPSQLSLVEFSEHSPPGTVLTSPTTAEQITLARSADVPRRRGSGVSDDVPKVQPRPRGDSAAEDQLLFPEPTKAGFSQPLKPVSRKKNVKVRTVAQFRRKGKRDAPILVCVEKIRQAKALSGLSDEEIGLLAGVSRFTAAAAMRCDPSVAFGTWCEVMNVLGIEPATLFPMRRKKVVNESVWQRGLYHSTEQMDQARRELIAQKEQKRRRRQW